MATPQEPTTGSPLARRTRSQQAPKCTGRSVFNVQGWAPRAFDQNGAQQLFPKPRGRHWWRYRKVNTWFHEVHPSLHRVMMADFAAQAWGNVSKEPVAHRLNENKTSCPTEVNPETSRRCDRLHALPKPVMYAQVAPPRADRLDGVCSGVSALSLNTPSDSCEERMKDGVQVNPDDFWTW